MRTFGTILCGATLLTGCAAKEFASTPFYEGHAVKYTGKAQDRVNAWPVFYWREPMGSFAWPLVSFGGNHFALRPLYSQYGMDMSGACSEINVLWPIAQIQFDIGRRDYRIFPFYWGYDGLDDRHFSLFPVIWYNNRSAGVPPFFWLTGEDRWGFFVFPLFWSAQTVERDGFWHTLFPLYCYESVEPAGEMPGSSGFWVVCGLMGCDRSGGECISHRILPLYFKDKDSLLTLLYGYDADSEWLLPVYYRDEKNFTTVVFSMRKDEDAGERGFFFVPLLSGGNWSTVSGKSSWYALAGLAGSETDEAGNTDSCRLLPLFSYTEGKSFLSLPYSWEGGGTDQTNRSFACSFVEVRSGAETGWSLFPFYDRKKDADYENYFHCIDAEELPEKIASVCASDADGKCGPGAGCQNREMSFFTYDNSLFCHLVDCNRSVGGCRKDGKYQITGRRDSGNILFCKHRECRRVEFDIGTRKKTGDVTKKELSILGFVYNATEEIDSGAETRCSSDKVLWKLWNREDVNGDVSLDVFPAFTYDSKKDGYVKASFLWRFFRYERQPEGGTDVDLLFIPVRRRD